jgi:hypothetical protein
MLLLIQRTHSTAADAVKFVPSEGEGRNDLLIGCIDPDPDQLVRQPTPDGGRSQPFDEYVLSSKTAVINMRLADPNKILSSFSHNNAFAVQQAKVAHVLLEEDAELSESAKELSIDSFLFREVMLPTFGRQATHLSLDEKHAGIEADFKRWERTFRPRITRRKKQLLSKAEFSAVENAFESAADAALEAGDFRAQALMETMSMLSDHELGNLNESNVQQRFSVLQNERNPRWSARIMQVRPIVAC